MTTTVMIMTMIQSIKDKISVELRPIYDISFEKVWPWPEAGSSVAKRRHELPDLIQEIATKP